MRYSYIYYVHEIKLYLHYLIKRVHHPQYTYFNALLDGLPLNHQLFIGITSCYLVKVRGQASCAKVGCCQITKWLKHWTADLEVPASSPTRQQGLFSSPWVLLLNYCDTIHFYFVFCYPVRGLPQWWLMRVRAWRIFGSGLSLPYLF